MPGMDEASIYEALGVTPEGEGAKEQEVAAPAALQESTKPEDEGAKEQGVADPAADNGASDEPETHSEQPSAESGTKESEEEIKRARSEAAAQRRRAEQRAAIDAAVEQALAQERERSAAEWKSFFAKANLKNTLTKEPITTLEEFNSWAESFEAAKLERDLKAGKLTPESLNKAIEGNPTVKAAQELIQRSRAPQPSPEAAAAAQAKIDGELQKIHELDPAINGVEDLLKMPNANAFYDYVKRGNTFLDAYYLANREQLQARTAEAAKQQVLANSRSKEHLTATGMARGAGAASVPAEEMELFRLLNPKATTAEIETYYNKTHRA